MEFGSDGFLYVSLGDGGTQNDPQCDAQNKANLLGKIIRLDVNVAATADGYPAAAGNPEGQQWFHVGLRNPWRMGVDPCTGQLYIGDVGQYDFEEVDVAPTMPAEPKNYGWPYREGTHDHTDPGTCAVDPGPWVEPLADYDHGSGNAICGGYVYRGAKIPWLRGTYFYGDNGSGRIWSLVYDGATVTQEAAEVDGISAKGHSISAFGQDGHGELYVADHDGAIYRIDPR